MVISREISIDNKSGKMLKRTGSALTRISFIFVFLLLASHGLFSQTFHYQNGISLSGGFSHPSRFTKEMKPLKAAGLKDRLGFSYELSYLNTKLLSDNVAFTYGLSVQNLRQSFTTKQLQYTLKEDPTSSYNFISTDQVIDQYHVGLSFRWTFFLNQGRNRFFIGPGANLSIPIYHVSAIKGFTSPTDSVTLKEQYFTEKGPYLFIPVEFSAGHQFEFDDCSLLRTELFFQAKGQGFIQKSEERIIHKFFGLRMAFFFSTE